MLVQAIPSLGKHAKHLRPSAMEMEVQRLDQKAHRQSNSQLLARPPFIEKQLSNITLALNPSLPTTNFCHPPYLTSRFL